MRLKKMKCIDCGKTFETKAKNKVRCEECQRKHVLQLMSDKYYREKAEKAVEVKQDPNVCTKVHTCIYRGKAGEIEYCNYLRIMGHRRPCDVQGCTEYKRRKRKAKDDYL